MPKIQTTVVVPAYNEADYLEDCLSALQAQTEPIDEILVVDNNSSDGSIERAQTRFPDVRFIFESKQGLVFARNRGFDRAHGEILIKIDADTLVAPEWHATILADFGTQRCVGWTGYLSSNDLHPLLRRPVMAGVNALGHYITPLFVGCKTMLGNNMAIRAAHWRSLKKDLLMRNDIFEDLDVSMMLAQQGGSVYVQRRPLVQISARTGNVSAKRFLYRTAGVTRQLRARNKRTRATFSHILVIGIFVGWTLTKPLAFLNRQISLRPNPDQN